MEESHHSARVKREGNLPSLVAHILELSSPREILSVLLRRSVEEWNFLSGWIFLQKGDKWEPTDCYPPLEAKKEEHLQWILPSSKDLKGVEVARDGGHFYTAVPLKARKELLGVMLLKGEKRPSSKLLRDLEILGTTAGSAIKRWDRERNRLKTLSSILKAQKLGKELLLLDSLEELKERVKRDLKLLTGHKALLLAPLEGTLFLNDLPKGQGTDSPLVRVVETKKPQRDGDRWLFPLVARERVLGILAVEKGDHLEKWKVEAYARPLAQALQNILENMVFKERYRGMVTSPLLCLFQLDEESHISFVNTSLALTLGYPMRETRNLVGKPFHQLVHPSSRPLVAERLKAQMEGEGRPEIHQITLADKEGNPVPMMVSTVPISLPGGSRGILGVAIDITEKERLLEDLSQRNKELESFAYSAAHELKGPIVYLKRVVAQPSLEDFPMEELKWAVNRLESTLKHLTAYSLMDNKEVVLERISPYLLVEGIWKDIAREVGITMDIAINLPPVIKSDPFLLELIFKNLLRNAFKYGIKGTPPLVEVGYTRKKGEFLFYVRDYGEGFPPEKAQEIFKPFVRLHVSKKGTGLGLTIAKKAVEKLGGRIWAEGKPGEGATFYFTHPIL